MMVACLWLPRAARLLLESPTAIRVFGCAGCGRFKAGADIFEGSRAMGPPNGRPCSSSFDHGPNAPSVGWNESSSATNMHWSPTAGQCDGLRRRAPRVTQAVAAERVTAMEDAR